jgi:hypothetical protein
VRGKHQQARQNRQARATQAELQRLRAEIETETQRAAAARAGAEQTRAARRRLTRELAATGGRLQPHHRIAARVVAAAVQASTAIAAARQDLDAVERELSRFSDATVREIRQTGVKFRFTQVHRSADDRYVHTWYRKKAGTAFDGHRAVHLSGWVPDGTPADRQALAPFATATVADTCAEACWAWALPPWLRLPQGTDDAPALRRQLGATTAGSPVMPDGPYPGPHPRPDAVLTVPWRHLPLVTIPADAVDLAHWYHRSAWIQQWFPEQTPVPFWLPTEHATAYPQARPLPTGTDIRLPYPMVLAALAIPWRIEPRPGALPAQLATAQLLMLHARDRAAEAAPAPLFSHLARLQAGDLTDRTQLPTPLEALDHFGGVVEGLLLTAHPDGTPRDEFAWCIAIGHPSSFPLARITVPASRNTSGWRTPIDNITAGIALSCWHESPPTPPRSLAREGGPADHSPSYADVSGVRVLDVDATSPPTRPTASAPTPYNARPHLRCGHWRKQRVGPKRQDRRWTWVRPTTVNGTPPEINQVYLLRSRQSGQGYE